MANVTIQVNTRVPSGLNSVQAQGSESLRRLANYLVGVDSGAIPSDGVTWSVSESTTLAARNVTPAIGALSLSSAAGSVGGSIGGTTTTVAASGGDTATATALAAAIRAAASSLKATATNLGMRVTLASVTAGQFIDIGGVRFTAINGTPTAEGQFDMSGTDTADAASLAQAINRHSALAMRLRAVSAAGVVTVFLSTNRAAGKWDGIVNSGSFSTFTVAQRVPTALPMVAVIATVAGEIGNEVRLTASGTGMTAVTAGTAGFLGAGTGGGVSPIFLQP